MLSHIQENTWRNLEWVRSVTSIIHQHATSLKGELQAAKQLREQAVKLLLFRRNTWFLTQICENPKGCFFLYSPVWKSWSEYCPWLLISYWASLGLPGYFFFSGGSYFVTNGQIQPWKHQGPCPVTLPRPAVEAPPAVQQSSGGSASTRCQKIPLAPLIKPLVGFVKLVSKQ